MVQSRLFKLLIIQISILILSLSGCNNLTYNGKLNLSDYTALKGKKIFIDPGHGGLGRKDPGRIGPNGVIEEDANLATALILNKMLREAGATTKLSRNKDKAVSLEERVRLANDFNPDIFISLHHNGTLCRADNIDYPSVLCWGNKAALPQSYDFAAILLTEFEKLTGNKGRIVSDFSVYQETGTHVLRETRNLCPGIIGEPSFFDGPAELALKDRDYLEQEAEAYFIALNTYFARGIPSVKFSVDTKIYFEKNFKNLVKTASPDIYLECETDTDNFDNKNKFHFSVYYNDIPVKCRYIKDNIYKVIYGDQLVAGNNTFRFSVRNNNFNSTPVYYTYLTIEPKHEDRIKLINSGKKLIQSSDSKKIKLGIIKLKSALTSGETMPDADSVSLYLSKGFIRIGMEDEALYYTLRSKIFNSNTDISIPYFPIRYPGKYLAPITYSDKCKK